MRLIDLDEFLRQNCVDRMEGKSCDECKHHVLEVSCERLMEQPTAEVTLCHLDSPCEYQNADIEMPIIVCGDCIHWICHDRRCGYWNHGVKPLEWCCHAERRTNG